MSLEPTASDSTDAWAQLMAHLPEYRSAVLNGLDAQGYPYSVRCRPEPDSATQTLRMPIAPGSLIEPGPASLLCHRHDERLWNQRSFLVRGALVRDGSRWIFRPRQYIEGIGYGGMRGMMRFVIGARRTASAYLAKRGLPRPSVPWDEVLAAKRQANLPQREGPSGPLLTAVAALLALIVLAAGARLRRRRS